jgi:AcrR family transcriptional regulator
MARQGKSVQSGTNSSRENDAPRTRQDLKREAIIAAAKELFFTQGYSGVSMDDIVARVGGSKATLYAHFPSKDDLLMALVTEATVGAVGDALRSGPDKDFSVFLRTYGRVAMRWRTSSDIVGLERLAASEALRFPEFGRTCYEQGVLPNRRLAAKMFAAAMADGQLRRADPLLLTDQFMGMCSGWMWRLQIWGVTGTPTASEINARVDAAVQTFMHGFATKPASKTKRNAGRKSARAPAIATVFPPRQAPGTRRELKRQAIVATAKELFFAEGYAGVSMNRIAERVGGSKATLYSHFTSREELLFAVIEDIEAGQALGVAPTPRPVPSDFREWLRDFGRVAVRRLTSHEFISLQRLAAGEANRLPDVGKTFYGAGVVPAFSHFVGYFADAMERGELRRWQPELAAEQFVEMCTGDRMRQVIWGILSAPSEKEIATQVDAAIATFMDGNAMP